MLLTQVIDSQNGVLFACPAQVHRAMYSGRGIIAPNVEFSPTLVDSRGYLPVEWWIMSKTEAKNAIPLKNEGDYRKGVGLAPINQFDGVGGGAICMCCIIICSVIQHLPPYI